MSRVLGQAAHLLAPTDPPYSLTDILYSRVSYDPDWGGQAKFLAAERKLPALTSVWPPPDLPKAALRRTLTGHIGFVAAVAIAPDSSWLVTGSDDWTVRIWDPATGQSRALLTGHTGPVTAVAIAPDGNWLATTSHDNTVRIWEPAAGSISALMRTDSPLKDCAWSPSGHLLAAAGEAGLYLFAFNTHLSVTGAL
jgi:WD40 repeat protein